MRIHTAPLFLKHDGMVPSPGKALRNIRERLHLKYRDVEEASLLLAYRNKNNEFAIGLSRLADIEHKGTVPSIFRMYSLSAIYGLDFSEILALYGVSLGNMASDMAELPLQVSRPVSIYAPPSACADIPLRTLNTADMRKTSFLSEQLRAWGRLPLQLLNALQLPQYKYVIVGTEDWSMHPLIPPGSFVQVDESKRKIVNSGWDPDVTRPIYFLELRQGFRFGWCTEQAGTLIIQPHPSAPVCAEVYKWPGEVDVIGQVVAVAMRLDRVKQRRKRSSAAPG